MVRRPGYTLGWVGAQRHVLAGDLTPRARLQALADVPHLYALGPLAGLQGEVTVIDGAPLVTTRPGGTMRVEQSFDHRACFLVHAEVPRWQWIDQETELEAWADLAPLVRRAAADAGLDAADPVPFRMMGRAATGTVHVLDRRDDRLHSPERHETIKVRFPLSADDVEVIGFYSDQHHGVFVPKDSPLHAHLAARNRAFAGHVDALRLDAGWRLGLPGRRERAARDYGATSRESGTQSDPQDEAAGAEAGAGRCSTARVGARRRRSGSSTVATASTMRL
jgi:acetolactate decarboxylase